MSSSVASPPVHDLAARAAELDWYHTIALADGVVTPGYYDTLTAAERVPLPRSLAGKRCLDVGTANGFWAFELERRGAAHVVGVDLDDLGRRDWPWSFRDEAAKHAGEGGAARAFALAREALGSAVDRVDCNVYDLSPERVGIFDFAYIGSLLLHLRDPIGALAAIGGVLDPDGGELFVNDVISLQMTALHPRKPAAKLVGEGLPRWWTPNVAGLRRMVEAAGFQIVDSGGPYMFPFGDGFPRMSLRGLSRAQLKFYAFRRPTGAPHAWVRARVASPV